MVADSGQKEYLQMLCDCLNGLKTALFEGCLNKSLYDSASAEKVVDKFVDSLNIEKQSVPTDIIEYLHNKIVLMANGTERQKGSTYNPNTVKAWRSFEKLFAAFSDFYPYSISWQDINKTVFDAFVGYMQDNEYMLSTINKYLICFKAIINFAEIDGLHKGVGLKSFFYKLKEDADLKAKKIYLTDEEIQALYDMELQSGSLEDEVRDLFVLGCYTALRVSDYSRLTADVFQFTEKGTPIIKLKQTKTGKIVTIPILNNNVISIAKKYDYEFPCISDVIINRYIKTICKRLSLTVSTLAKKEITVLTMKERDKETAGKEVFERNANGKPVKSRYDLVCTHTARRSAITNLYKTDKLSTVELMSISGHNTEKSFKTYLCLGSSEIADRISEKMQF
jgi:integrase